MSTPLDKHGYVMSESDGQNRRYRLILGFATLDDLQEAHEYVVRGKLSPNAKTVLGSLIRKSRRRKKRRADSAGASDGT